jgi:TPR repeat protein
MPRITISYRRDDSGVITGRIFDRLAAHYGREAVFRDIDDIPPGVDFRKHISDILDESDIVLAIVGPRWIGPRAGQNRLSNTADPVRVEIEIALRKDRPLIPVLVLRGSMPRVEQLPESLHDFAFRNAVSIDAGQDFDVHMARLIRAMDRSLEGLAQRAPSGEVEGVAATADVVPGKPVGPEPSAPASAGSESLPDANREAEERRAALTVAPEAARTGEEAAAFGVSATMTSPPTLSVIDAVRGVVPAPGLMRRRARTVAFVLLGVLLGFAVTYGANQYLMRRDQPIPAAAEEKLAAAQKQLSDQANSLRDARARADKAENDLIAQKNIASNALAQNGQLNNQVKNLSDQLAAQQDANRQALAEIARRKAPINNPPGQPAAAPAPTPATPAPEGEASLTVDEKRELQLPLRALGHLQGDADGNLGPGTRAAIKQFQSFEGLPETGVLSEADRKTLLEMAQRLSQLLERSPTSPEGVAATSVKGGAQRYARASAHDTGKGARKDPAEAVYWYGLAAVDGSAPAFTNLGTMVARGYGDVKADPAGAAILWWAAAARGEAVAMFNLGALWERGIGVSVDLGRARAWYERAAARNDPAARAALKRLGG